MESRQHQGEQPSSQRQRGVRRPSQLGQQLDAYAQPAQTTSIPEEPVRRVAPQEQPARQTQAQPTRYEQPGRPQQPMRQQQPVRHARPTQQEQLYAARSVQRARRRARKWPWVVAVLVVVALWIPIIGWLTGALPGMGGGESSATVAQTAEEQGQVSSASEVESQAEEESEPAADEQDAAKSEESSSSSVKEADLSWRDAEFAVDPSKETAWTDEPNGRKVVYLTIDDGPSENTQAVLDILDQYNCKATFFVTGICPDYAYQIKEEYRRGHTVGMHTYSHDYAQVYASTDAYFADLDQIAAVVSEQIGYVPCFIRFPGGSSNGISADYSIGIMSVLVDEVQAAGYQYYDWNASIGDGSEHTTDELVGYACEYDDLENIVLLCHDSSTKQTTVEALPRIIEHYQDLGYTFEAIDRTTMVPHHGVNN